MNPLTVSTLSVVGGAATVGAVLMGAISLVNRSDGSKYRAEWLKFGILLLIVVMLLGAGTFGKWGLLPIALFLAYFAWQELVQSVEKKYGAMTTSMLLPILGILGTLGGLWGTSFTIGLGVVTAAWGAIALPIIISRKPAAMHSILAAGFGMIFITLPLAILLVLVDADYGTFTFLIAAQPYRGGSALVIRLAPYDYHRFHFPDDGQASPAKTIKGQYHSVNPIALARVPDTFCRNKRAVTDFNSKHFGRIAYIEVGALTVASIVQTYTPGFVSRGQEKGHFQYGGSTLVLLFEPGAIAFEPDLIEDSANGLEVHVLTGSRLGKQP